MRRQREFDVRRCVPKLSRCAGGGLLAVVLVAAIVFAPVQCIAAPPDLPGAVFGAVLPNDTALAIYIRPAELAKAKMAQPVVDAFDKLLPKPMGRGLGISVAEIEEFKIVMLGDGNGPQGRPHGMFMVVRARAKYDWEKYMAQGGAWQENIVDGRSIYDRANGGQDSFWLPDDRTLVYCERHGRERSLESPDPNDPPPWADRWKEAAKHPLAGLLQMSVFFPANRGPQQVALTTLVEHAKFGVMYGQVTPEGLKMGGGVEANSAAEAGSVASAASQALVDFANLIAEEMPLEQQSTDRLVEQLTALLAGAKISTRGSAVDIEGLVTAKMLEVFAACAKEAGKAN